MRHGQNVHPITLRTLAFSGAATIGTISAGSNQLTVASATGFAIGNSIIVAVGGESGTGLRGSKGVGGTWPALFYADTTAMNADSGQAANTYAWVEASGDVYRYVADVWTQVDAANYYTAKVVPKALVTTITGIAGSVLTLAANATNATTNANVYFDNLPVFNAAVALGGTLVSLSIGAGTFAVSDRLLLQAKHRWELKGAGRDLTTIFVPDGVFSSDANGNSGGIWAYESNGVLFRDFHYKSNARENGFGLFVTETNVPQGSAFPRGVFFGSCTGGIARNLKFTDVFQDAVGTSFATDVWAYNCKSIHTAPLRQYIQWDFQWSDSTRGGCVDCEIDSEYLVAGFEAFKSTGTQFIRPIGRNAVFSMNGSGSFLVQDAVLTINANSQDTNSGAFSASNPIFNVSTNAAGGYPELGGTISNFVVVQEGYINASNDTLRGIVINVDNPDVTVNGGSYTAPNYAAPSTLYGAWGYDAPAALNPVLSNFTVVGTPKSGSPNISIGPTGTLTNCTAQVVTGP